MEAKILQCGAKGEGDVEDEGDEDEDEESDRESGLDDKNDDADESSSSGPDESDQTKSRSPGFFKQWALKQLSNAKPYVAPTPEEEVIMVELPQQPPSKKRKLGHTSRLMRGPLGEDYAVPSSSFAEAVQKSHKSGKKIFVDIQRPPEIAAARLLLPIISEEQQIVETILLNSVTIIYGETGSGKTTQVPQFLYEAGFGHPDGGPYRLSSSKLSLIGWACVCRESWNDWNHPTTQGGGRLHGQSSCSRTLTLLLSRFISDPI